MTRDHICTTLLPTSTSKASHLIDPDDPNGPGAYAVRWIRQSQLEGLAELQEPPAVAGVAAGVDQTMIPITDGQVDTQTISEECSQTVEADTNNNNNDNRIPTGPLSMEEESITVTEHHKNKQKFQQCHVILIIIIAVIGGSIVAILATTIHRCSKKGPSDATGKHESESGCNFDGTPDPSPVLQCSCTSKISVASVATKLVYTDMKTLHLYSEYDGPEDECLPVNMALWWTAMDISKEISTSTSITIRTQRHGLALLYMSLDGWNHGSTKWLGEGVECEWEGIFCTSKLVSQINLTSFGLIGELPGSPFHFLPALIELALSDNTLHGSIPSEIWTLEDLEILDLSFNGLSNTIPNKIIKLKKLNQLMLDRNLFTGSLPNSLYNLTLLTEVFLEENIFTGTLSKDIAALSNLTTLSMSNNGFHGLLPSALGLLTQISTIFVDNNDFTGTLPSELGLLSNCLKYLDASFNLMKGTLPPMLGSLTELYFLRLTNNKWTGTLPDTLGNLSSLHTLILAQTMLTALVIGDQLSDQTMLSGIVPSALCLIPELSLPCTVICDCCHFWNETFPCQ